MEKEPPAQVRGLNNGIWNKEPPAQVRGLNNEFMRLTREG
jgi:hypothetical protein